MRWEKSKLKLMFQSPHVCYSAALPKDQVVRKLPPNGGNRPAVISLVWRGCKTLFWIRMKTLSWPWWTPIIRNIINLDNREYVTWETMMFQHLQPSRHWIFTRTPRSNFQPCLFCQKTEKKRREGKTFPAVFVVTKTIITFFLCLNITRP